MGQPVVHFEIIGKDGEALWRYYSELFGWEIDADNPMNYGMVRAARGTSTRTASASAAASRGYPDFESRVTSTSRCRTSRRALAKAESLGGTRIMGPDTGRWT